MAHKNVIQTVRDTLFQEMGRDERVIVMGEDVGLRGGVFRATEGLIEAYGEERVIDTPLAELGIIGTAIGMAVNGLRPIAEIQFADFIHAAFDQILSEAARMRYRSNGAFGVPLVIRTPYGGPVHGGLYHSQSIEAFYAHIPGLKVVTPSTPHDTKGLLLTAIRDEDPVMFLEHKRSYRAVTGDVPEEDYTIPFGQAHIAREGDDLSIFAYGMMVHEALSAAETLVEEGIEAEVVDLRSLRPLDRETILQSVEKTAKALVVHEDNRFAGFGAEVAALIGEEAFEWLDGPVMRLGAPEVPAIPYHKVLEEWFYPGAEKIAVKARALAEY